MCGTALGTTAVLKLSKVIQFYYKTNISVVTMILLQPGNPKGLKLHEAMEEKGLVLAVLSAGMTFSTLKISVGALLFGKNNRSCK